MLKNKNVGTVFWITGLAGAGKTSISKNLYNYFKMKKDNFILLDGDSLRKVLNDNINYSLTNRHKLAMQYAKLCKLISDQQINVICSTISMFDSVRKWNRENIVNYIEIFIDVPLEILKKRNQKNLYKNFFSKKEKNIIGLDLEYEKPKNADIIINNDNSKNISQLTAQIIQFFKTNRSLK